jgi:hypothetical protein
VIETKRHFGNSEEGERLPLEAVTRELVKTQLTENRSCSKLRKFVE